MKRVLVAGASGFVGSQLARRLLADGHEVHLLLRPSSLTWRLDDILPKVRAARVDLVDENALKEVVGAIRPQWIFNCAGSGIETFRRSEPEILRSDFEAAVNLVRACAAHGFEAFVHSGSSTEYGWKDHAPTETEACEPNSCHGAAKVRATDFCRRFARGSGAPIVTLRLYTVYGPFESPRRLIPRLVACGLRDALPALARPEFARDFVHVDDVVNAYVLAAVNARKLPGGVFNIGTGRQSCLKEVVEVVRKALVLNAKPQWRTMPDRPCDTASWRADGSLAKAALGWTAAVPLEEGIRRFHDWLKSSPSLADFYARESA
jgi:UDP-glucose 4-epimerase